MLNITSQWQGPEILIFLKSLLRKIRSHAETPYAEVSFWSVRPFKGYRKKTGSREAETDSRQSELLGSYLIILTEKDIYDSSCLAMQNHRKISPRHSGCWQIDQRHCSVLNHSTHLAPQSFFSGGTIHQVLFLGTFLARTSVLYFVKFWPYWCDHAILNANCWWNLSIERLGNKHQSSQLVLTQYAIIFPISSNNIETEYACAKCGLKTCSSHKTRVAKSCSQRPIWSHRPVKVVSNAVSKRRQNSWWSSSEPSREFSPALPPLSASLT